MGQDIIVALGQDAIMMTIIIISPLIGTALVIGLMVGVFQTATSIQEQTLTFLPKMLAVLGVFIYALPWFLEKLVTYTTGLFGELATYTF